MLLTSPQSYSFGLRRPAACWALFALVGAMFPGCGADAARGFPRFPQDDSTTAVRVISQFFLDNRPEDIELQIVGPYIAGCAELCFDEAQRDRIIDSVGRDTRDVKWDGTMPVGIETLLAVNLHGPHYSLRIRLLRGFGLTVGAMLYQVENPALAEALTGVCERNGLLVGYEGRELKYSLAIGAGIAAEPPGPPTAVEREQIKSTQQRLGYAYDMSQQEWTFLKKFGAPVRDDGALHARDLVSEDGEEQSPLHWAAYKGWREATQYMLLRGADPDARTGWGWTALHLAASRGHRECVGLLLLRGADVSATGKYGSTPLHLAASPMAWGPSYEEPAADIVEMLVLRGANLNARNEDGRTPLHLAARGGLTEVVARLVRLGADVPVRDRAGKTPLQYAQEAGNKEAIRLLQGDAEIVPGNTRSPK